MLIGTLMTVFLLTHLFAMPPPAQETSDALIPAEHLNAFAHTTNTEVLTATNHDALLMPIVSSF